MADRGKSKNKKSKALKNQKPSEDFPKPEDLVDVDKRVWLQEAIRSKLCDVAEHIDMNSQMVDTLHSKGVLTPEERGKVTERTAASEVLWLLLKKEEPSIWPDVLEVLSMEEGQEHVVDMIKDEAERLKQNPEAVLKLNREAPPSPELQNSARLASLLLDHGTGLLAGFLCDKLDARFGSLEATFDSVDFQQALEDHCTGCEGAVQLITHTQYHMIQQSGLELERVLNFDFSVILNLLDIVLLQGHSKLSNFAKQEVSTLQENINVLKYFRTMIFSDIQCKGMNAVRFNATKRKMTETLEYFTTVSSQKRQLSKFCRTVDETVFSARQIYDYRCAMMLCQDNDELSTRELIEKYNMELRTALQAHGQQSQLSGICINSLAKLVHDISCAGAEISTQLETTAAGVTRMSVGFKRMEGVIAEAAKHLKKQLDRVETKLDQQSEAQLNQVLRVETKVEAGTKQILSKLEPCQSVHLNEVCEVFQRHRNSFKILLMNRARYLNETREELSKMLGQCDWDFIVDFDYESRATGIHDSMSNILRGHKHFCVLTYNEDINLSEPIKNSVANGEQAIWFLANGCSETNCPLGELSFGKVLKPFDVLLESILREIEYPKPLLVVVLLAGGSCKTHVHKTLDRLLSVCEVVDEHMNFVDTDMVIWSQHQEDHLNCSDLEKIKPLHVCVPLTQAIPVFSLLHSFSNIEKSLLFPGDQGSCTIPKSLFNRLQTLMVLYHKDIGKVAFDAADAKAHDRHITEKRLQYLRGAEDISPEAFYLHKQFGKPFYALRTDMEVAKQKIEAQLELRKTSPSMRYSQDWIRLQHDRSGGGSTVLEYVLYTLKDSYPCVKLRYIDQSVPGAIKTIWKNSNLPVLVAIDNREISADAAQSLAYLLSNELVPCVVVVTESANRKGKAHAMQRLKNVPGKAEAVETHESRQIYVSSTLTDPEDKLKFKLIYEEFNCVEAYKKVYLFGLNAFCEDYKRLNEVVFRCMEQANDDQLKILRIVCCLDKYANFNVKLKLLISLLPQQLKCSRMKNEADAFSKLGIIGDLLTYEPNNHTVRSIHQCIVKPVYEHFGTHMSKRELMTRNVEDLIELITKDSSDKRMSQNVCIKLIVMRMDQLTEHYSPFLQELIEVHDIDKETVGVHLKKIIDALKGYQQENHIRALYARFLLMEVGNVEDSVTQMKLALGIRLHHMSIEMANSCQDHHLLSAYGNIYRHVANIRFKKYLEEKTDIDRILALILRDVKESVCAFRFAQSSIFLSDSKHQRRTPFPYTGETLVRTSFLHKIFEHKCNKDHEAFRQFIANSTDSFIQDCETNALDTLDKILQYKQLDKLQDLNPTETFKLIVEQKFKLLRLRHDSRDSSQKLIRTLPSDTPCDIGMLVRVENGTLHTGRAAVSLTPWDDLSVDQLEMIITRIDERIGKMKLPSCNYSDIIKAMITLRQHGQTQKKFKKYNLDYAIMCAETWQAGYPDHLQAHFMCSVLSLTKGLKTSETRCMRDFRKAFSKCHEILQQNPSMRDKQQRKYEVGLGDGLSAVLPYSRDTGKGKLRKFEGRLVSKTEILVHPFGSELTVQPAMRDEVNSLPLEQKPIVFFNLIICYNAILAHNIEMQIPPSTCEDAT